MRSVKCVGSSSLALALVLSGCTTLGQNGNGGMGAQVGQSFDSAFNNPNACSNNSQRIGMVVGAVGGAILGRVIGGNFKSTALGAGAGFGAGLLIGAIVDHRRCEIYRIAQANNLQVATGPITAREVGEQDTNDNTQAGMNLLIQDHGQFEPGSAQMTPNAQAALPQIAQQYSPATLEQAAPAGDPTQGKAAFANRAVLVINRAAGNAATAEADQTNLSSARAQAVAQSLASAGVSASNIYYQGTGDSNSVIPSADGDATRVNNSTQIVDFPNKQALQNYLAKNAVNPPASVIAASSVTSGSTAGISQPTTGATVQIASKESPNRWPVFDFGGQAVSGTPEAVALGPANNTSVLSLVTTANAASPLNIEACVLDHPRSTAPILNYGTGEELSISGASPGFYGAPWAGGFNGNLVDALHVYVPSNVSTPTPSPTFEIYKNYHSGATKPDFQMKIPVNVYRGQDKILYRMFVDGPIECVDLVVASGTPQGEGELYYRHNGKLYATSGMLALQR